MTIYGMEAITKRDPVTHLKHAYSLTEHVLNDEQRAALQRVIDDVSAQYASPGRRAAMRATSPDE